jgi:uncharacterized protein (DUF488 family)
VDRVGDGSRVDRRGNKKGQSMTGLFTIGYEGADLADFLTALRAVGVTTLLDVRELPISRRKGFSKLALGEALGAAGIAYQHERLLGSPRDARHRLKATGDMKTFLTDYEVHLAQQTGLLDELALTLNGNVALMCYERDARDCHRRVVARELGRRFGIEPRHLGVHKDHGDSQRAGVHTG